MAFIPKSRVKSEDLEHVIIDDSKTIAVGEAVITSSNGFVSNGAAGGPLLGIVIGFDDSSKPSLQPTAYSAGTATSSEVSSVTAAADNTTSAKKRAIVCTDRNMKWSAAVSGTLGTTNNSDQFGGMVDVDSSNTNYDQVLETTFTRTAGTATNFFSYGVDPDDSDRLIVSIACSEKIVEQS